MSMTQSDALELSSEEAKFARRMLRAQRPREEILAAFGNRYDWDAICDAVKWLRAEQRRRYAQTYARRPEIDHVRMIDVPPDALAERDRRAQVPPRDLTAAVCGDPLPGYSALDRRRAEPTPRDARRRDPLDALLFMPR